MSDQSTITQAAIDRIHAIANMSGASRFEEDETRLRRDPTSGRITSSPDFGSDADLIVEFTTEEVFSKSASFDAGGVPTYVAIDFITMFAPGKRAELTVHTPVTDFHMWRFPKEYDLFKAGANATKTGTALAEWPLMSKGQIRDLNYNGIHTVEQLANLSDSVSGVLRGFYQLKSKANTWLAAQKGEADLAKSDDRDAKLDEMQAKIERLMSLLATQVDAPDDEAPAKKLYGAAAKAAKKKSDEQAE